MFSFFVAIPYTISIEARKEVPSMLLELNHKMHEEVKAGLWDTGKPKRPCTKPTAPGQEGLIGDI